MRLNRGVEGTLEHTPTLFRETPRAFLAPALADVTEIANGGVYRRQKINRALLLRHWPTHATFTKRNDIGHANPTPTNQCRLGISAGNG